MTTRESLYFVASEPVREPLLCVRQGFTIRRITELRVTPNRVPRYFLPAAVWRTRDAARDPLFAETANESLPVVALATRDASPNHCGFSR
jgi:hypothetical protein